MKGQQTLTIDDNDRLFSIFSDQAVVKFYNIEAFTSKQQSLDLIDFFNQRFKEQAGIRWAIRLKETGELIGTCGFNSKMHNAVIGYEFASDQWGTTEALNKSGQKANSGRNYHQRLSAFINRDHPSHDHQIFYAYFYYQIWLSAYRALIFGQLLFFLNSYLVANYASSYPSNE